MKISIKDGNHKTFVIWIPIGTYFGLYIIKSVIFSKLRKNGVKLRREQKKKLSKALKKSSRLLKGQNIVDIVSAECDQIKIWL